MPPGKKIKMYYDPRGNVIRTVNPDKSEQWVVYGKPNTLNSIAINNSWSFKNYVPTAWESYTYDADDLASLTNGTSCGHDFTPKSATVDALGRTVKTIDRLSQSSSDDVMMKYQYDIRGNLLKVTDALNRIAFTYTYDLRPQPKKQEGEEEKKLPPISTYHIDSGVKTNISDATGKAIELRDAKGAQVLSGYDTISRPINIWEKDKTGETTTLRQHLIYGDSAGLPYPDEYNHLGKLYQQYDEAGLQQINKYDFKGNITDKFRKVISDATLLSVFGGSTVDCYRVNWQGLDTSILDAHEHQTNSAYDALNRVTALTYPEDVSVPAKRKVLLPTYNNAGALENVVLLDDINGTPTTYVNHIAYNAKGQRILIAFGNTVMTRYTYDKKTFRLKRQRTETYTQTGWTFASDGNVKQDTAYVYDLIGNILGTNEATTGSGVNGSNNLLRQFTYDDLYRLLSATGRENAPLAVPIWDDSYRSTNNGDTTAYIENYQYDKMGNILQLQHIGVGSSNNYTRNFNYNIATNNRLQSVDIGMTNYVFSYDANGNQLTETSNRKFEWDAADRMRSFYTEASGSITKYTQYLYDTSGKRVKKLTWVQSGDYDSSTYIDGIFEYRTDGTDEQNTLHVMDDKSRIATIRIGDDFGDITPAIKYNIEDHLGSSTIQLETNGASINKEEYYPFGETSFGSYAKKRYKYCGKERDDESGLYYYGARYYSAWCCRFVSVDPLKDQYTYYTPYQYAGNKPINFIDLDGREEAQYGTLVHFPDEPLITIPTWDDFNGVLKAVGRGLENTAKVLAPIRPAQEGDPKTLSEAWEGIKSIPANLYHLPANLKQIYSNGTVEQKVETTIGLFGMALSLKSGNSSQSLNVIKSATEIPSLLKITNTLSKLKGAGVIGECKTFVESFLKSVKVEGATVKRFRFESDALIKFDDKTIAAFKSYHEWIEVEKNGQKFIFDNINPNGMKAEKWWSKFDAIKNENPSATGQGLQKYAIEVK